VPTRDECRKTNPIGRDGGDVDAQEGGQLSARGGVPGEVGLVVIRVDRRRKVLEVAAKGVECEHETFEDKKEIIDSPVAYNRYLLSEAPSPVTLSGVVSHDELSQHVKTCACMPYPFLRGDVEDNSCQFLGSPPWSRFSWEL